MVHKDLRLQFDGNRYCVPHRFVGRRLTVKADSSSVTIYHRYQEIVSYARSWRRGQTFGAERFERELAEQRPAARRSQAQQRFLDFMDGFYAADVAEGYLRGAADSDRVLPHQLNELLELIRQSGPDAVAVAIAKRMPLARSATTTSPTFSASSKRRAGRSRPFVSAIRGCRDRHSRHSFASNHIRRGGSHFRLMKILGHTSLEMTRKYVDLQIQDLQAVHNRLSPLVPQALRTGVGAAVKHCQRAKVRTFSRVCD